MSERPDTEGINIHSDSEVAHIYIDFEIDDVSLLVDRPMELFSSCLRSMLISSPGKILAVVDFASIEARVLAWLAGQQDLVRQFVNGDDTYKHMAASIFGVHYNDVTGDQRFVGKTAVLGCGYGLGADGFLNNIQSLGGDISRKLAAKTVKAYRAKNQKIVSAWYDLDRCVREAIAFPGKIFSAFLCKIQTQTYKRTKYLLIRLPSSRTLVYVEPAVRGDDNQVSYLGSDQKSGAWWYISTYGGKLVENIVQAVARDIMCDAMLRVENTPGFDMLLTVHDELVAEVDEDTADLQRFVDIVKEVPPWASGCPIDAEGWVGKRYRK